MYDSTLDLSVAREMTLNTKIISLCNAALFAHSVTV